MKKGFTLAEVLITLVIIGVIAAMTIPTLINSTGDQEYKTGLKKAFATLNQIVSVNAVVGDYTPSDLTGATLTDLLTDKLATVGAPSTIPAISDCTGVTVNTTATNWIYTSDGFRYFVNGDGKIVVDTNGDKGPNRCMVVKTGADNCAKGVVETSGDSFILQINATGKNNYKSVIPSDDNSACIIYGRDEAAVYPTGV